MGQAETGAWAVEADGAARQRSGQGRLNGARRRAQDPPHEPVAFRGATAVRDTFDRQAYDRRPAMVGGNGGRSSDRSRAGALTIEPRAKRTRDRPPWRTSQQLPRAGLSQSAQALRRGNTPGCG